MIELPNEDDSKKTDIIINLDEKESSTSCENYNIKSEVKCIRNNNITKKEFDKTNIQINKGLKSETKIYPSSRHNIKYFPLSLCVQLNLPLKNHMLHQNQRKIH